MLKCFKYLLLTRQNNNRNSKCTSNPINLILSKFIDALTEKIGKFDIAFDKLVSLLNKKDCFNKFLRAIGMSIPDMAKAMDVNDG